MTLVNDGVNQLIAVRIHHFFAKENNHSRTEARSVSELNNSAPGRACIARGARDRGGGGRSDSSAQCIYTYTAPQKNSVLKGLLPTRASLTVYHTRSRSVTGYTYRNPSDLVYHKMSVYDFSFMIPFILYSLKELRLGLNCLMKLLPYGTQSITRNLGLYTYTKYFF